MKKSVISLIAYDANFLPTSIKSYYKYVDEIILGLDIDKITWSGNSFSFDEQKLFDELAEIDVDDKISLVEDNFHGSAVALENDNYERNFLKAQCSNDWIFSFDADEVLVNPEEFFVDFCPLVEPYAATRDLLFTWFLPYKKVTGGHLVIANEDNSFFKGDRQGFATWKPNTFTYCRWTENKKALLTPLAILHWSFCRQEHEVDQKINNFGHSDKTAGDPFFDTWKKVTLDNFEQLKNFKTSGFGESQWNKLIRVNGDLLDACKREAKAIY